MKILLVEDSEQHIEAAKNQLQGHELTIVNGFDEARVELGLSYNIGGLYYKKYKNEPMPYDVLLTDVMIPKGGYECMDAKGKELVDKQGLMPYGPILVLHAAQRGIKHIGILTDGNRHSDPFGFAFDDLHGFKAGDIKIVCASNLEVRDSSTGACSKDWATLLRWTIEGNPNW